MLVNFHKNFFSQSQFHDDMQILVASTAVLITWCIRKELLKMGPE